jgi:hypothetical protein
MIPLSSGVDDLIAQVVETICLCRMPFCSIQQFGVMPYLKATDMGTDFAFFSCH